MLHIVVMSVCLNTADIRYDTYILYVSVCVVQ